MKVKYKFIITSKFRKDKTKSDICVSLYIFCDTRNINLKWEIKFLVVTQQVICQFCLQGDYLLPESNSNYSKRKIN